MFRPKRILVPMDFSDQARLAFDWAVMLAGQTSRGSVSTDLVHDIRFSFSPTDPQEVRVIIDLAEHAPACCISGDSAFVEFYRNGHSVKASFIFVEDRPAHRLEAALRVPAPGLYSYRIVGKILDRSLTREGTCEVGGP